MDKEFNLLKRNLNYGLKSFSRFSLTISNFESKNFSQKLIIKTYIKEIIFIWNELFEGRNYSILNYFHNNT